MANQTRIVLDQDDRPKAEQILEATGIKTFSQLFSIFLINYGDHLVNALKSSPVVAPPPPVMMPASEPIQTRQLPTLQPERTTEPKRFTPMTGL